MNCIEFRRRIEDYFGSGQFLLSAEMQEHINNCEACGLFLIRMKGMKRILDKQEFEIIPGELDLINADSILRLAGESNTKTQKKSMAWYRPSWVWSPVAAAAMIVFMLLWPHKVDITNSESGLDGFIEFSVEDGLDSQIYSSDSLGGVLLTGLIGEDEGLDKISDELVFKTDIDELLSLMSAEELNQLYDALSEYEGRDG